MPKQKKITREKIVIRTSLLGILANLLLSGFKVTVGLLSNSIAIISDAVNNLTDAMSSIVTIIGTKLANKAPDRKHPYGYGRIEYMTSLIVSFIVLYAGATALIESIKKIITPETVDYDVFTLIVIGVAVFVKFVLGFYVKKKGREAHSDALVASGTDAFNDGILSGAVFVSAIIYLIFKVDIEAYVSVVLAGFIIKTGIELVKESVSNILGTRVESKLARAIKKEILKEEQIEGAFDLILHNYGPDQYQGSVHIEVPDTMTAVEIDKISRRISARVIKKFGVVLHTIGIYSMNTKDKEAIRIREDIKSIVFAHEDVLQFHGFYYDEAEKVISFDIIIDFVVKEREKLYCDIYDEIKAKYPDYNLNITLDVDVSD
ncbi:cation transporter [Candidatus Saccharibacteria bacterium]|nr:cation transporter [Candidatus Saccharibacteria bacterium]